MLRVRAQIFGWPGGPGLWTSYFLTPLEDDAAALRCAAYVHGFFTDTLRYNLPVTVGVQVSGDVDVVTAATGAITNTRSVAPPAVVEGNGGTTLAPPAIALLLKYSTATFIAGRRVQGRSYNSPLAGAMLQDDGTPNEARRTGTQTNMNAAITAVASGDTWVIWHRPKLGAGGSAVPITAVTVPDKFAILTSRRD